MSNTGRVVACNSAGKKSNRWSTSGKWLAAAAGAAWVQLLPSPHGWQNTARADLVTWNNGSGNNSWDGSSQNWLDVNTSNSSATYVDGDTVQFPGSGPTGTPSGTDSITVGSVTAGGGVSPSSVEFTSGSQNYTLTDSGTVGITGGATVTLDSGYTGVVIYNSANSNTGATTINGGTLRGGTGSFASTATINIGGGTFETTSSATSSTYTAGQAFVVTAGSNSNFSSGGTNPVVGGPISSSSGATAGGTTLNINTAGTFSLANLYQFTGTLNIENGSTVRINNGATSAPDGGSATAIFEVSANSTLQAKTGGGSGTTAFNNAFPLGALESSSATSKLTGASGGSSVYAIGALGLSTTFAGVIGGGNPITIETVGGALTLTNNNTYTNVSGQVGTYIAGGALYADNTSTSIGATGTGGVIVGGKTSFGAGTLGGNGLVTNGVTVNTTTAGVAAFAQGGLIAPGASGVGGPIGTLTITGGLTLNDWSNLAYTLDNTPSGSNDLISTSNGNLTLSGNSLVQVAFAFDDGGPELGVPYDLINYGTGTLGYVAGGSNASVSGWTPTGVPAGDTASFSTPGNGQVDVTFTAVPEPATIGMLGIASIGLVRRRRNRA